MRGEEILEEVARERGVTVADLRGPSRRRRLVLARREAVVRLRRVDASSGFPPFTQEEVAGLLNRDRSTISYHELESLL